MVKKSRLIISPALKGQGIYLILSVTTMLTFVHFRGSDLANRTRANVAEWLYQTHTIHPALTRSEHQRSLCWQVDAFLRRYVSVSIAMVLLLLALSFIVAAIVMWSIGANAGGLDAGAAGLNEDAADLNMLGSIFILGAFFLVGISLILAVIDFSVGSLTLKKHATILKAPPPHPSRHP